VYSSYTAQAEYAPDRRPFVLTRAGISRSDTRFFFFFFFCSICFLIDEAALECKDMPLVGLEITELLGTL
jgi:hypothetical protein